MALGTRLDARRSPRFYISAPIFFTWHEDGKGVRDESGMTENMSIKGMFVITSECPSFDSVIDFVVQLPGLNPADSPLAIQAQGRVTRIEYGDGGSAPKGFSLCGGPWGVLDSGQAAA